MKRSPQCAFCGEPCEAQDWADIGGRRAYLCGSPECEREAAAEDEQCYEEALDDFNAGWGR